MLPRPSCTLPLYHQHPPCPSSSARSSLVTLALVAPSSCHGYTRATRRHLRLLFHSTPCRSSALTASHCPAISCMYSSYTKCYAYPRPSPSPSLSSLPPPFLPSLSIPSIFSSLSPSPHYNPVPHHPVPLSRSTLSPFDTPSNLTSTQLYRSRQISPSGCLSLSPNSHLNPVPPPPVPLSWLPLSFSHCTLDLASTHCYPPQHPLKYSPIRVNPASI